MNKRFRPYVWVVLAVTIIMVYVAFFGFALPNDSYTPAIKGMNHMRFGIDIRGGVDAAFQPKDLGRAPTSEELESARVVIETRLDSQNIFDRRVTVDKTNGFVLVQFPWKSDETDFDPQQAIAELGEMAMLTFRDPDGNIVLEGKHIAGAAAQTMQSQDFQAGSNYVVTLQLTPEGNVKFSEATGRLIDKQISIYMDETLLSSPTVKSQITGDSAFIEGMGTMAIARDLADKINAGALPFALETRTYNTISPTLGQGALNVMVQAGLIAFALILVFMVFYYRLPGAVACITLVMQMAGQLLALSIPQLTLTLPGIAALILSLGMGIDANVIICERIRDELRTGKTLDSSISSGFARAFSAVFDGNFTNLIVAVVLMILGSGMIFSFAYTLMTGVFFNLLAGVLSSRLMIHSLNTYKPFRKRTLFISAGRLPQ